MYFRRFLPSAGRSRSLIFSALKVAMSTSYPAAALASSNSQGPETEINQQQRPSEVFRWLGRFAPVFCLSGSQVSILHEPADYYEYLQTSSRSFRKRAILSALYLGTGKQEVDFVNTLQERCSQLHASRSPFDVHVLVDYQRGSRGAKNSRTMLLPLLQSYKDHVKVSLYHTPDLRGVWKTHMPERWNEIVGLLHMKVCVFDDDVLITGANLSDQYFVNRQDRYVLIKDCPQLANFFQGLVDGISNASFNLQADNDVKLSSDQAAHPFEGTKADFIEYAKDSVRHAYSVYPPTQRFAAGSKVSVEDSDTWIYPLVQMKQFDVLKDEKATEEILSSVPSGTTIHLASGYFNLTRSYRQLILSQTQASYNILMASPRTNGFFGAEGASGNVPSMYVQIAKTFFTSIRAHAQQHRVRLFEYYRDGWTYHVKGLWATLRGHEHPSLTLVGSPNFGYRSVNRDIEAQIAIVTENVDLQKRLAEERDRLFHAGQYITDETFQGPDHHVPWSVRLSWRWIKNFF